MSRATSPDDASRDQPRLVGHPEPGDARLIEIARRLPTVEIGARRHRELGALIVSKAATESVRPQADASPHDRETVPRRAVGRARLAWAAGGLAAAAAVTALWVSGHTGPTETTASNAPPGPSIDDATRRATVKPSEGAVFGIAGAQPDETVRVWGGTVDVEVDPLRPGERFRLITSDAAVEVKGTEFEVTVTDDRLERVTVEHGVVEVRVGEAPAKVLRAGDVWSRPSPDARAPEEVGVEPHLPLPPAASGSPVVAGASDRPGEKAFEKAWEALRHEQWDQAAELFAAVPSKGAFGNDARYWRGVALARAGKVEESAALMRGVVDGTGSDARKAEAAVVLGWLILDRGKSPGGSVDKEAVDQASVLFESAKDCTDPQVQASARRGVEAVRRARESK